MLLLLLFSQSGCIVMIHDISTDLEDPPRFQAVLPLRKGAANPPAHPGAKVAAEQRRAYPDIQPLQLKASVVDVWAAILRAAETMGWRVVASDQDTGVLEAVATTRFFRFKDDIVVRMRNDGGGVRVDVRSKSRIGKSDLGANARRIRAFLRDLARDLTKQP